MRKAQNNTYLANVQKNHNMTVATDLIYDYGVPIVVVGCKSDSLTVSDISSLKKNAELQRDIRHICSRGLYVFNHIFLLLFKVCEIT